MELTAVPVWKNIFKQTSVTECALVRYLGEQANISPCVCLSLNSYLSTSLTVSSFSQLVLVGPDLKIIHV